MAAPLHDLGVIGANVEIPAFIYPRKNTVITGRSKISKQSSLIRIHVERVISLMKNKYLIMKGPLLFVY